MARWPRWITFGTLALVSACTAAPQAVVLETHSGEGTSEADAGRASHVAPVAGDPTAGSFDGEASVGLATPNPIGAGASWIVAENARPGTTAWQVDGPQKPWEETPDAWIEGYADRTSVELGGRFVLYVDTPAPSWWVTAYRMGWYGGARGRQVWRSGDQPGGRQPVPTIDRASGMAEARWQPSLRVDVGPDWPPGTYLLKLETGRGGAHLVPITVRDDGSTADLLVVSAVTTWQAYNDWGACSLYRCLGLPSRSRASVVSFDRPYFHPYQHGAADFPTHELPLVAFVEELGLDVTYITDVDLHERPERVLRHRAVVSLGHDEYHSTRSRGALELAKARGVNLAFLGANAVYRHVRLDTGWDGRPNRRMVNRRSVSGDPVAARDPSQATVEFRRPPLDDPEWSLVGIAYACSPVEGDLVVVNPGSWVYAGTGVRDGQVVSRLVGNEYDRVFRHARTPDNLELLAYSPVRCAGEAGHHAMAYHSAPSGAGVFATGTIWWICSLEPSCMGDQERRPFVRRVTENVLRAFAAGPAGSRHPSRGNVDEIVEGRTVTG